MQAASDIGFLVSPPIGDDGLKVEDARHVVELLMNTPVGDQVGVLIVGPMDEANPKAADTLLKCLEEAPCQYVQPILWANDLGGVPLTIRSRCLERWAPDKAEAGDEADDSAMTSAYQIVDAVLKKDWLAVVDHVRRQDKREATLLAALSDVLATKLDDPDYRRIWNRLRVVCQWKTPWVPEIVIALTGV